jgi:hypothetical protein
MGLPTRFVYSLIPALVLALLVTTVFLTGCGDKYAGTWRLTSYNGSPVPAGKLDVLTLRKDGGDHELIEPGHSAPIRLVRDGDSLVPADRSPDRITVDGDELTITVHPGGPSPDRIVTVWMRQ